MSAPDPHPLRIGDWRLDPAAGQISRGGEVVRLGARTLRLLLDLAEHAGQVVSIDDLLDRVWAGVIVTPDSVYQAVAALRRLLGDDPKRPRYIANVPRLGYRMVAKVGPWTDEPPAAGPARAARRVLVAGSILSAAAVGGLLIYGQMARARHVPPPPKPAASIGVLTFLDMTDTMDNQPLTEDLTEAVVDRLSQNPALRTPGPRSSFSLRGKHLSLTEAARRLGVAYVVDGSVHSAPLGAPHGYRVTARLVRGDTGFVVWSQSYDRSKADMPEVAGAIAGDVGQALAVANRGK
ncbi:MAG: transcriptional regulator protein [Phenylobacterium sp.]|nr:transcriptional regulator protein [Phenylobacterium sp.]